MRSHSDIAKAYAKAHGGRRAAADRREVSVETIGSWIVRDKIPDEHWAGIASDGVATLEELADYSAQKREQKAAA